jgi:hypothetical protein
MHKFFMNKFSQLHTLLIGVFFIAIILATVFSIGYFFDESFFGYILGLLLVKALFHRAIDENLIFFLIFLISVVFSAVLGKWLEEDHLILLLGAAVTVPATVGVWIYYIRTHSMWKES